MISVSALAAPAKRSSPDRSILRFRARVQTILAQPEAEKANWGVLIVDRQTGQMLYEHNAAHFFTPASNTKLFTTAFALSELGPDFRWRTTLETSAPLDASGMLHGDLILVGRGDPDLSNRVFPYAEKDAFNGPAEKVLADLADQVVAHGVKQITGDIVADDSYFTYQRYPPGWAVSDLPRGFGAPVSAIIVDDNTLEIDVAPGANVADPVSFQVLPYAGFYHFNSLAATAAPGSETKLDVLREPDSLDVTIVGQIAVDAQPKKLVLAIEQPSRFAASLLKLLLEKRGVAIYGRARAQHLLPYLAATQPPPQPSARQVLAQHESPALGVALRYLLKVSQNLHAEAVLRTVGHEKTGVGSRKNALDVEHQFLAGIGIADQVSFADGSGLSRNNLVTPQAVVALLRYAAAQTWFPLWFNCLPVAGQDGTLGSRMQGTVAAERIDAKTGTLNHVSALSGYATSVAGEGLIFSIFANDVPPDVRINPYIDQIAVAMVEELGAKQPASKPAKRPKHRGSPHD